MSKYILFTIAACIVPKINAYGDAETVVFSHNHVLNHYGLAMAIFVVVTLQNSRLHNSVGWLEMRP